MTARVYEDAELARFRDVQRLAYRCTTEVAAELGNGVTEREAATRLRQRLEDAGVVHFFHEPFAWFGDRTSFQGMSRPLDFFPSTQKLRPGMPAILDVAPAVDGYVADIGYAFSLGDNPVVEQGLRDLQAFRELIADRVGRGDAAGEVYRAVEDLLVDMGYRNCHRKYPFGVLAHRVYRLPQVGGPRVGRMINRRVFGFSFAGGLELVGQLAASRLPAPVRKRLGALRQRSPFVNVGPGSEERLEPGLWAFEPHIARGGVGIKWEEQLVVDEDRAYWLDDEVPHLRGGGTPQTDPQAESA